MLKIKPLRPSMRERKRYIRYEITGEKKLDMKRVQKGLLTKLNSLLGVFQSAKAGLIPISFETKTQEGILRVNHTAVDLIRSCFVLIKEIEGQQVMITTKNISGILRKVKN